MKTLIFLLIFISSYALANGSSSIGNAIFVADGVFTVLPDHFIEQQGGQFVDAKTKEPLVSIGSVARSELSSYGDALAHSKFGSVDGFEYLPTPQSGEQNFWVICTDGRDTCTKLAPLSRSNPKVPAIVGALTRTAPTQAKP